MVNCKFCNQDNLEWYQDFKEKWVLGIKLDVNTFRQHECKTKRQTTQDLRFENRKGWIKFKCICDSEVWLSKKHYTDKELLRCNECKNMC